MMKMNFYELIDKIPDFPTKGIIFYDIQRLIQKKLPETIDAMSALMSTDEWEKIDLIAAIDARGFIFASALAYARGKGILLIRKKGKLPPPTISQIYSLEYNTKSELEISAGKGRVLVVDDILATGGTLQAAIGLCRNAGYEVNTAMTLITLPDILTMDFNDITLYSLLELP